MRIEGPVRVAAWAFAGVLATIVAFLIGSNVGRTASLDGAVVARLAKEKSEADATYQQTIANLNANKVRLAKLENYEKRMQTLQSQVADRQRELSSTNEQVAGKRSELESLTGKVDEIRRRPIDLPAGHFTVGQDIRPGRYTVVGSSNFFVKGADGETKVNTILGGGDIGVDRYVCELAEGDTIQAEGADRFYPMD